MLTVRINDKLISLTSNGIVKCLLRKMAGLVRRVENLIVKNRKIERKSKTDGVVGARSVVATSVAAL